jgi:phosphatidylinositol glycan class Z
LSVVGTTPWEYDVHIRNVSDMNTCTTGPYRSVSAGPLWIAALPVGVGLRPVLPWLPISWRSAAVLAVPRFGMFLLSLLIDLVVVVLAERGVGATISPLDALLATSSSHVMLVFHTRTFSNATESVALALLLAIVLLTQTARVPIRSTLIGACCIGVVTAFGVMARFTFLAFALPSALLTLAAAYRRARAHRPSDADQKSHLHQSSSAAASHSSPSPLGQLAIFLAPPLLALVAFLATLVWLVWLDELWFGSRRLALWPNSGSQEPELLGLHDALATLARPWLWPRVGELNAPPSPLGSWSALQRWLSCLAPLNALRYNSQTSNLAEHGIHPRVTHALVNLPLMFGPLTLYLYYRLLRFVQQTLWPSREPKPAELAPVAAAIVGPRSPLARRRHRLGTAQPQPHIDSHFLFAATVASGLVVLSLAPHQEARFLTPLLVPLTMLCCSWLALGRVDDSQQWRSSALVARWLLWLLFNGALVLLFGVAHQGGVVRALANLYSTAAATSAVGSTSTVGAGAGTTVVLFYASYTPPLHLLLQSDARWARDERLEGSLVSNTYELYSVPRGKLHDALDSTVVRCVTQALARSVAPASALSSLRVLVVAPRPALDSLALVAPSNGANDTLGALRSLLAPISATLDAQLASAAATIADDHRHDAQLALFNKQLVTQAQSDAAARHVHGNWQPAFEYQLVEAEQFWPHVSFEDTPSSVGGAVLSLVRLRTRTVALHEAAVNENAQ